MREILLKERGSESYSTGIATYSDLCHAKVWNISELKEWQKDNNDLLILDLSKPQIQQELYRLENIYEERVRADKSALAKIREKLR